MFRLAPRSQSPMHQALRSTALMAAFGLALDFIWAAYDPEVKKWDLVATAPVIGLLVYLQATGRLRLIAVGLIGLGLGGLLFWTLILLSGSIPITGRADYAYITLIFAFPALLLGLGVWQLRKLRKLPVASPAPRSR